MREQWRERLVDLFRGAVAACDLGLLTRGALSHAGSPCEALLVARGLPLGQPDTAPSGELRLELPRHGRIAALALGKGAAAQTAALGAVLGPRLSTGLLVAPEEPAAVPAGWAFVAGAHPLPTAASEEAALRAQTLARTLSPADLLICAISGGASALVAAPAAGVTLADKVETTRLLLDCGADIDAINCVRKHLSAIKGGQLATGTPARCLTLLASDVLGNRPDVIGSGPTVPDWTTFEQALAVVQRFALETRLPATVLAHLRQGASGAIAETPKATDPMWERGYLACVAAPEDLLQAAVARARACGLDVAHAAMGTLGEEATAVAAQVATAAPELALRARSTGRPQAALWVREPVLQVRGSGAGGRNSHLAMLVARALRGLAGAAFLAAGSDGIDGKTAAAGAVVDGDSWQRSSALGIDAEAHLAAFDSGTWAEHTGCALVTGRTGCNLLDLEILVVDS
jgi:glycerate 2-kinase